MRLRHQQIKTLDPRLINKKLEEFFQEDETDLDITTRATHSKAQFINAHFIAKEALIFAGKQILEQGLQDCVKRFIVEDGAVLDKGDIIAIFAGNSDIILNKERVLLNLIQRLSGIASTTNLLTKKTNPLGIQLLDTRKTTPGLRLFEKYAVYVGGGTNHRFSLKEAVMIKDNHLVQDATIESVVERAYKQNPQKDIQLEVDNVQQLESALKTNITSILLDNFNPKDIPRAIKQIRESENGKNIYIELSGGITSDNIADYCIKGVDGISMGALTHNIKSKDIGLDLQEGSL